MVRFIFTSIYLFLFSCSDANFAIGANDLGGKKSEDEQKIESGLDSKVAQDTNDTKYSAEFGNGALGDDNLNPKIAGLEDYLFEGAGGSNIQLQICSVSYDVPATANPYFAGSPTTATLQYNFSRGNNTDSAVAQAPVDVQLLSSECLRKNARIFIDVQGAINHGGDSPTTSAEGNLANVVSHQLGGVRGKSNITAPINSLLGVFLEDGSHDSLPPPESLSFATAATRDYEELEPKLGQIFYIGDGRTNSGMPQFIRVPENAKRFFLGIMDSGQWNNNSGSVSGKIMFKP